MKKSCYFSQFKEETYFIVLLYTFPDIVSRLHEFLATFFGFVCSAECFAIVFLIFFSFSFSSVLLEGLAKGIFKLFPIAASSTCDQDRS